jgi:hypothetical protein
LKSQIGFFVYRPNVATFLSFGYQRTVSVLDDQIGLLLGVTRILFRQFLDPLIEESFLERAPGFVTALPWTNLKSGPTITPT